MKLPSLRISPRSMANPAVLISLFFSSQASANCNFSEDTEEIVRGSVYSETNNNDRRDRFEAGIAGVNVSNGCQVVQTDGGGNYQSSIVDLLKLLDLDSSLAARKELANELNVHAGEDGSAEQNIALHKAVMAKLAENGGIVPDSLRN